MAILLASSYIPYPPEAIFSFHSSTCAFKHPPSLLIFFLLHLLQVSRKFIMELPFSLSSFFFLEESEKFAKAFSTVYMLMLHNKLTHLSTKVELS